MNIRVESYLDFLRKDPRAPLLTTVVLALLLILSFGQMVTSFTTDTNSASTYNSSALHSPPNITSTHLFGQYSQTATYLPPTQLQLTLEGIELAITPGNASYTLINSPGQTTKLYEVGDTVPGGATIHGIFHDRVVLTHNGHLEALYLPVPKTSGMITSATQ